MERLLGPAPPRLVALHGFTQHGGMFAEIADCLGRGLLAPDLPGHGVSSALPATWSSAIDVASAALDVVGPPAPLLGYSQGGRIALAVTLERPRLVSHLILISASLGPSDRVERMARDQELASSIEDRGVRAFLDEWLGGALLAGLRSRGPEWLAADRRMREENTASGLAAAIRGLGQATQPDMIDRLGSIEIPVLVLAGSEDPTYVRHAQAIGAAAPVAFVEIVSGAGHALVGERPAEVADRVARFLGWSAE